MDAQDRYLAGQNEITLHAASEWSCYLIGKLDTIAAFEAEHASWAAAPHDRSARFLVGLVELFSPEPEPAAPAQPARQRLNTFLADAHATYGPDRYNWPGRLLREERELYDAACDEMHATPAPAPAAPAAPVVFAASPAAAAKEAAGLNCLEIALNPSAPWTEAVRSILTEKDAKGRFIGWPEADTYRRSTEWVKNTAAPGLLRHNRKLADRLMAAVDDHAPDTADAATTKDEWAESEPETLRDGSVSRRFPVVDLSALPAARREIEELAVELDTPEPLDVRPSAGPGRRDTQPAAAPENNWTAWIVNARGDRTYETTGHPSRLDALNQAWTDNPDAREVGSGFGYIGSNNVQWQSAQSRHADLRVLAASDAIATPDKPAALLGPGTCPDGQPHRYRPLTTEERIGYREIASERELDAARKCLGCGAWSDAASVAREAGKPAKLAALALAALLPLLAAGPAHAAGAPKAPRHGKPVAGCVKQASGKWAKQTPTGKWSTVACEPEITLRITDRANGARDGYEVRYVSPERCTVWVADKRADDAKVIGAAYDACIDTMAEKGGA